MALAELRLREACANVTIYRLFSRAEFGDLRSITECGIPYEKEANV